MTHKIYCATYSIKSEGDTKVPPLPSPRVFARPLPSTGTLWHPIRVALALSVPVSLLLSGFSVQIAQTLVRCGTGGFARLWTAVDDLEPLHSSKSDSESNWPAMNFHSRLRWLNCIYEDNSFIEKRQMKRRPLQKYCKAAPSLVDHVSLQAR